MLLKFIVAISFLFPLAGIWLMENGAYGGSIDVYGFSNGATQAFVFYAAVAFATMWACGKYRPFEKFGKRPPQRLRPPGLINLKCFLLILPMLAFVLFALGGINTIVGHVGSGEFRASLRDGGFLGYMILKYFSPSLFAFALMTNVAWTKGRTMSLPVLGLAIINAMIAASFGFKSSIVLALLPAAILYYWRASPWNLVPLGAAAFALIVFGYLWFGGPDAQTFENALSQIFVRLFTLQGDVSWKVWDIYVNGEPLPSYINTLPEVMGDTLLTQLTDLKSPAGSDILSAGDRLQWVQAHFSLMATHLTGYPVDHILAGHNNSANVFSEALIAGGFPGLVFFGVLVGVIVNLVYVFINNRLQANDFASASVAASYFVMGVMAWLLGGGIAAIIHISIVVSIPVAYLILKVAGSESFHRAADN